MKRSNQVLPTPTVESVLAATPPSGSLADQAYAQLRAALMEGVFQPGEPVVLQAIADKMETSVQPVREAVMKLAAENAFELLSGRSARVPQLSGRRFMELCDVRMLLETRAAQLAAEYATRDDLAAIQLAQERMRRATRDRDTEAALRFNREFHFAIYRAAHHDLLASCIERLWLQCGPYFRAVFSNMTSREGARRKSTRHHDDALVAIRSKDPSSAGAAIAADIAESASWYRRAHRWEEPAESANGSNRQARTQARTRT